MIRIFAMATLIFLVPSFGSAQPAQKAGDRGKVEKEITDVEARRFRAMREVDTAALESILAEDLTYTHSNAWLQTKGEFIGVLRSGELKYESIHLDDVHVRVYGPVAVVTGRAAVKAKSGGQEQSFNIRYLDVYVKQKKGWQMVAWQSTRLAP